MKQLFTLLLLASAAVCHAQTHYQTHNADCSTAETLPVSGSSQILRFTQTNLSGGGGQSSINDCNGSTASFDVWYKFTATGTTHDVLFNYNSPNTTEHAEAFSGTCGSLVSIGCTAYELDYGFLQLTALTPGQTYHLRLYNAVASTAFGASDFVRIAVTTPLSNDDCAGATTLDVITDVNISDDWRMFHTFTASESQQECSASPTNSSDDDVWFKFTATAAKHSVNVQGWGSMGYSVQVFSGSCGSLSNEGCKTNGFITVGDLIPGDTYHVRVYSSDNEKKGVFQIAVLLPSPNDECDGAETIEVTSKADCARGVYFDFKRASVSDVAAVCGSSSSADLWYKFQPGTDDVLSKDNGDSDADVAVYSGGCASLTCIQSFTSGDDNLFTGLNPSETYYLRVSGDVGGGRYVCLSKDPGNDDCADAIDVAVKPYGGFTDPVYGNVAGKTNSAPTCNSGTTDPDVWYKFTATASSVAVSAFPFSNVEVMSGSCGSFTTLACGNAGATVFAKNLTIGTTYYIRVHTASSQEKEFVLRVSEMAPNDECVTATVLTPQTSSYVDENITYGRINASFSMPGCTLPYFNDDDVWFKFTATDTAHAVLMKDPATKDMILEMLSGSCGSLTSLWCNYTDNVEYVGKTFFGLTPGQNYFLRVYSQFDSVSMDDHRFSLIVTKPPINDEMSGAIAITQFAPTGTTSRATFSSHSATKSHGLVCTGISTQPNHDVWFYFIAQETTHTVKVSSENNFSPDPVDDYRIEAFSTFTSNYATLNTIDIGCGTNTVNLTALTVGDTVYVRVFPFTNISQTSDFSLSISTSQNIDEPGGALLLTPTNSFTHGISTANMTQTLPPTNCRIADNPDDDVWFKFVATSEALRVVCDGENRNMGLELFSGTPGSLVFVKCADNILVTPDNLAAGTTYYVRAFSKANAQTLTCDIGLYTTPDILADVCIDLSCLSSNLVAYPSCEYVGDMPTFNTDGVGYTATPSVPIATGWYCPTQTSPDCWDADMPWDNWGDAPSDDFYSTRNVPRSGKGNLGFFKQTDSWVEYVSTGLSQPMTVGHYYYVSYYVMQRNDNAILSLGTLFTTDSLYHPTKQLLPYPPQIITSPDQDLTARKVWRRVCDTVYADKPYEHMTIGMFATIGDNVDTDGAYTFIDDVFVSQISAACMPVSVPKPEALVQRSLNVYPNPATDMITVVSTEYGNDAILNVYAVTGELLMQTTQANEVQKLNLQNLPSGVYVVQVTSKTTSLTQKVVLQR